MKARNLFFVQKLENVSKVIDLIVETTCKPKNDGKINNIIIMHDRNFINMILIKNNHVRLLLTKDPFMCVTMDGKIQRQDADSIKQLLDMGYISQETFKTLVSFNFDDYCDLKYTLNNEIFKRLTDVKEFFEDNERLILDIFK